MQTALSNVAGIAAAVARCRALDRATVNGRYCDSPAAASIHAGDGGRWPRGCAVRVVWANCAGHLVVINLLTGSARQRENLRDVFVASPVVGY